MKPFSVDDVELHALRSVCERLAVGEPVPSVEALTKVLNLASEFSAHVYEGHHIPGAFRVLASDEQDSRFSIRLREVSLSHLRTVTAAAGGGDVVMREDGTSATVIGIDIPQYVAPHCGVRFSFATRQAVYVSTRGVVVGSALLGRGLQVFEEVELPSPDIAFGPASLSRALTYDRVLALVSAMRSHGHGGTIVFRPGNDLSGCDALAGVSDPWQFASSHARLLDDEKLRARHTGERKPMKERESLSSLERKLDFELRSIGTLTRADGAVVVNGELELLGFAQRLSGEPPLVPPRLDSVVFDYDDDEAPTGGTRLSSTINFVNSQPDAVVLCVSADGPVRLIWSEAGQVRVREHLEAFL
ncbi:MAG: hypothetical protein ACO1OB_19650 [Archangium sp.]